MKSLNHAIYLGIETSNNGRDFCINHAILTARDEDVASINIVVPNKVLEGSQIFLSKVKIYDEVGAIVILSQFLNMLEVKR